MTEDFPTGELRTSAPPPAEKPPNVAAAQERDRRQREKDQADVLKAAERESTATKTAKVRGTIQRYLADERLGELLGQRGFRMPPAKAMLPELTVVLEDIRAALDADQAMTIVRYAVNAMAGVMEYVAKRTETADLEGFGVALMKGLFQESLDPCIRQLAIEYGDALRMRPEFRLAVVLAQCSATYAQARKAKKDRETGAPAAE